MKALTLHEPWASLVAFGFKTYETRSWSTSYRGLLAIHAAQKWDQELAQLIYTEPFESALTAGFSCVSSKINRKLEDTRGRIVAVTRLVDVMPTEQIREYACMYEDGAAEMWAEEFEVGDFSPGRFAWQLAGTRRVDPPIPIRGRQRLWNLSLSVTEEIHRRAAA